MDTLRAPSVHVGSVVTSYAARMRRTWVRVRPVLAGIVAVGASLAWLVAAMGLVPVLNGLWISGLLFSVLIAWALVRT